jgi:hypothetical protein
MTAQSLLSQLREKGVQLKVSGADRLVIDAPKGALTSELRSALADHKAEILKALQGQPQDDQEITEVAPPAVAPTEPAPAEESAPAATTAVADTADEELMPTSSIAEEIKRLEAELLRLRAEEETRRSESETRRLAAEHTLRVEQERQRQIEEEVARQRAQEERQRIEAEERERADEEYRRRIAEEQLVRAEEELKRMRVTEQQRRIEVEARLRAQEEAWVSQIEARRFGEEEREKRRAEQERQRMEGEARERALEEEAVRRAAIKVKAVEEAIGRIQAREDARHKAAEDAGRRAEEEVRRRGEEEARRRAKEEALRKAEEEARLRAQIEAQLRTEAEARRKAEEEIRRRAEEELRWRSEEEARRRAEEEARRLAEEEGERRIQEEARRRAAEEETRRRAEEVSRRRSEEAQGEARRQAEADVRRKMEEEARQRAEMEARIRAEVEAKIRAEEEERAEFRKQSRWKVAPEPPQAEAEPQRSPAEEDNGNLVTASVKVTEIAQWIDVRLDDEVQRPSEPSGAVNLPDLDQFPEFTDEDLEGGFQAVSVPDPDEVGEEVSPEILKQLRSRTVAKRAAGLAELARSQNSGAFRHITEAFDDKSAEVRTAAARALFDLQSDRAAAFTRALREADPDRRQKIGAAIASSGLANEAISNLTGEGRDKTYDAFSLLFLMSKAGEVQPLMRAIEEHSSTEVRLAVVKLLALSGQPDTLAAFRRMAVRGSLPPEVRSAVMEAIYQMTSQSPTEPSPAA